MVVTAISSNPNQQVLPKKRMIASNTNINKQPRFFKTKQTKLSKILQLPKPSNYEQRVSKQTLSEIIQSFVQYAFVRMIQTSVVTVWSGYNVLGVQCGFIVCVCIIIDVKKDGHYNYL